MIRNNPQRGKVYIDKATNATTAALVSVQGGEGEDVVKKSDILFTEDTTVIHISGNRDTSGRIVKVSHGLSKCFGYSK